ncbi:U1 small nuclear ribonucleoprotein C-like isoform X2 [Uloborus diversus]|uniref:U1 small nuclear ribonucleoprotein C-like isoform X2 n=1 Tax=Uloborus diversus TaxID=327109 RepID=UPI002409F907|nr:U1 small nuclear ribonucleoprotein C-like isoform X2 [Uloborus diversus]XP_054720260.1 U1 small nuclear ribonucleoprotein C-like isoform X2 [Uloborus diversus]
MFRYYCDYCDTYLTHDSPSVRKTHCNGRKHKDNVKFYYQKWMEEQAQSLIDATTAAFKAGKIQSAQFAGPKPPGAMIPPPPNLQGPARPAVPGQRMPIIGPPPMGPMVGPMPGPMPTMGPPGPIPHNMMVPGMRPPVGHIAPMMPIGPVTDGASRPPIMIPRPP